MYRKYRIDLLHGDISIVAPLSIEPRFSTSAQAEAALLAVQAGQIYLDGVKVSAGPGVMVTTSEIASL